MKKSKIIFGLALTFLLTGCVFKLPDIFPGTSSSSNSSETSSGQSINSSTHSSSTSSSTAGTSSNSSISEQSSSSTSSSSSSGSSSQSSSSSSSSESIGPIDDSYYASITDSMKGSTLLSELKKIINNSSVSQSYDWSRYKAADEDPNNKDNIITIYARTSMSKSATDPGSAGNYWNREHTFPQSKMTASGSKSDNHIIYASDKTVNGKRGNIPMGVVDSGSIVYDSAGKPTTCKYTSSKFDPHNIARGIVARTTMYAAAMYGFDPEDNFESITTMMQWHFEYWVTAQDMKRNEVVYANQHNRNPFIDHPEYACRIWGDTNSTTRSLCGM